MRPGGTEEKKYFNPRSPHGERLRNLVNIVNSKEFQSTLPARGATRAADDQRVATVGISIHAPRTGSDSAIAWMSAIRS